MRVCSLGTQRDTGNAHAYTHTRTHARTHALTHARTHAHTHTHTRVAEQTSGLRVLCSPKRNTLQREHGGEHSLRVFRTAQT